MKKRLVYRHSPVFKKNNSITIFTIIFIILLLIFIYLISFFIKEFIISGIRLAPTGFVPPPIPSEYSQFISEKISGPWNVRIFAQVHSAGIHLSVNNPTGSDSNVNIKKTQIFYKEASSAQWIEGHPFTGKINKSYDLYVSSLFYLKSSTSYDVRVDLKDGSGNLIRQISSSFKTQEDELSFNPVKTLIVDKSGRGDFTTIQAALDSSQTISGTRILIKPGVYSEKIVIKKSGTPGNWIQLLGEPGVVLDGHDSALENLGQGQWQKYSNANAINCENNRCWTLSGFNEDIYSIWRDGKYFYRYIDTTRSGGPNGFQNFLNDASGQGDQCNDVAYSDPNYKYHLQEGYYYDAAADKIYLRLKPGDSPNNYPYFVSKLDEAMRIQDQNWIWIEGINFRYYGDAPYLEENIVPSGPIFINNSNFNVIRNNNLVGNGHTAITVWWEDKNKDDIGNDGGAYNRIEHNTVSTLIPDNWRYCETKKGASFIGISMRGTVGNIIRHNELFRVGENSIQLQLQDDDVFSQGVEGCGESGCDKLYYYGGFESDVYGNYIHNNVEGIEPDGHNLNLRIYDNFFKDMWSYLISLQPGVFGPHWAIRNIYYNNTKIPGEGSEGLLKIRMPKANRYLFLYHNTYVYKRNDPSSGDYAISFRNQYSDVVMRNNILTTENDIVANFACNLLGEAFVNKDINYNNYFTSNTNFINYENSNQGGSDNCADVLYSSTSLLCSAKGLECNGRFGSPGFSSGDGSPDFSITSGSGNRNAALLLQGINYGYEGTGPDIGALEFGQSLSCDNNKICEPRMGENSANCANDCIIRGAPISCIDNDGDGFGKGCLKGSDCNDSPGIGASINPGATEICGDNIDNDCDGFSYNTCYYVDGAKGNDANDGLSLSNAWKTIDKANSAVRVGDAILIRAGTYNQNINPSNNGNQGNEIIYANYNNEMVTITKTADFSGKSYIVIKGLNFFSTGDRWVDIQPMSHHLTFLNNYFNSSFDTNDPSKSYTGFFMSSSSYIVLIGNFFERWFGGDMVRDDNSHHILFDSNDLSQNTAAHASIHFTGTDIIIRNNYFRNPWDRAITVVRLGHQNGENILIENNVFIDNDWNRIDFHPFQPVSQRGSGETLRYNAFKGILRNNIIIGHNLGKNYVYDGALGFSTYPTTSGRNSTTFEKIRAYHNTLYRNRLNGVTFDRNVNLDPSSIATKDNRFKNNIISETENYSIRVGNTGIDWRTYLFERNIISDSKKTKTVYIKDLTDAFRTVSSLESDFPNIFKGNIIDQPFFINQKILDEADARPQNFKLNNLPDFFNAYALTSTSPGKNQGTHLASVTVSGTGNRISLDDALYFSDGFGLIDGDVLIIGDDLVRVTDIVDDTRIDIDQSITVQLGDKVYLALSSSKPDVGVYGIFKETLVAPFQPSCVDNDGDGYGEGCLKGDDCDDADPLVYQNCGVGAEIIVDNLDAGFSGVGNWQTSRAVNPYGTDSLYSAIFGDSASWTSSLAPGIYNVYAWWTYLPSRSQTAPYSIYNGDSLLGIVRVNQNNSAFASRWNLLGEYTFDKAAKVTLNVEGLGSYSADAVNFIKIKDIPATCISSVEVCNGKDDDCDGNIDEGVSVSFYRDGDLDTYGAGTAIQGCLDNLSQGYVLNNLDCNDNENSLNLLKQCSFDGDICGSYQLCVSECPFRNEICGNGIDEDCNGSDLQCSSEKPLLVVFAPAEKTYKNKPVPVKYNASRASNCGYYLNGVLNPTACSVDTNLKLGNGKYSIEIFANNSFGITKEQRNFSVVLTRKYQVLGNKYIESGSLGYLEDYTDEQLEDVSSLTIELSGVGEIEFLENVNLTKDRNKVTNIIDIDNNVLIDFNKVRVDPKVLSSLNKKARISLEKLTFGKPLILKDGVLCNDCILKSYSNGKLVFDVAGFSIYSAMETPVNNNGEGDGGGYVKNGTGKDTEDIGSYIQKQRIIVEKDVKFFVVEKNEEVILEIGGEEYIVMFNIEDNKTILNIGEAGYDILQGEMVRVGLGDGNIGPTIYVGVKESYRGKSIMGVSLDGDRLKEDLIEGGVLEGKANRFLFMTFLLMIIVIIAVVIILLYKKIKRPFV